MKNFVIAACLLLGFAVSAQAQAPYLAEFTAAANHNVVENGVAVVSGYKLFIIPPAASTPLSMPIAIGKPTPDAFNTIAVDVTATMLTLPASLNCNKSAPTAATCYTGKVVAEGPGGTSEGAVSAPFPLVPRAPAAPGQLVIK